MLKTRSSSRSQRNSKILFRPFAITLTALAFFAGAVPGTLTGAMAQDFGRIVSPILTIDREKLFTQSSFGQRIAKLLEEDSSRLAVETRDIEAALEAEEQELTDKRATMDPTEFRALADAFDQKVQNLRSDRDAAQQEFVSRFEGAQKEFFDKVGPLLAELVRELGGVMVLDRRVILLTVEDVDITARAITRINNRIGDGSTADGAPAANDTSGQ